MKIEILSGSPRKNSLTHRVAIFLQKELEKRTGHETGLIALKDLDVPTLQSVWKNPEQAPAALQPVARRIFEAEAFILLTPEYNGGYSPALKNLLDHFPKHLHKPFGIATASDGALGGMRAAQQLLLLVPGLFGIASPQLLIIPKVHEKFNEEGELTDEKFQNAVNNFLTEFLWLAERIVTEKATA